MACRFGSLGLALLLALSVSAPAAERTFTIDPGASRVAFTLGTTFHEVHGTMAIAGGVIRFDAETGAASGAITVDARSAATGNRKRDRTMHAEILESERFPTIVFTVERVEGRPADSGRSDLSLTGTMSLHGADHPMVLRGEVDGGGDRVRGDLRFAVPYVAWGLRDPSFFIVRAEKTVDVTVHAEGRWTDGVEPPSSATGGRPPRAPSR
jgi:polyisoprenoid-binding protein YceI